MSGWSEADLGTLRLLVGLQIPMRDIACKLQRPEEAVRQKAHWVAMADMIRGAAVRLPGANRVRGH